MLLRGLPSKRVLCSILWVGTAVVAAAHAQTPPAIDLATIGKICTGQAPLTVPGGATGSGNSQSGYTFNFTAQRDLEVSSGGVILYKIEKPTLDDVASCVAKIAGALTQKPLPQQRSCRIPANGIEGYSRELDVQRNSPEMSGGHSQPEWCNNFIAVLRGEYPNQSIFSVVSSSESSRSGCAPFNCPLYTYSCTVHIKTDPIYKEKQSPECPN